MIKYRYIVALILIIFIFNCYGQSKINNKSIFCCINSSKKSLKYLSSKDWDILFPNRKGFTKNSIQNNTSDFYSYQTFVKAASYFPKFLNEGDSLTQKRELAAFLAHIAQETSDGWNDAPGGYFAWGLVYIEEQQKESIFNYVDSTNQIYPAVKGKLYFGRGPKQISWNYNYGQFSEFWYGSKDSLLNNPERLATDQLLSFSSAIWFWMTPQTPKPSCHEVITGLWKPNEKDLSNGRSIGFGNTLNIINGGLECGKGYDLLKSEYRYKYYELFCKYLNVPIGENVKCTFQKPYGSE